VTQPKSLGILQDLKRAVKNHKVVFYWNNAVVKGFKYFRVSQEPS